MVFWLSSLLTIILAQALSIKYEDIVTETKEQQHAIAKEWFEKYGGMSHNHPFLRSRCLLACAQPTNQPTNQPQVVHTHTTTTNAYHMSSVVATAEGKMTLKQLRKNLEKIGLRKRYGFVFLSGCDGKGHDRGQTVERALVLCV